MGRNLWNRKPHLSLFIVGSLNSVQKYAVIFNEQTKYKNRVMPADMANPPLPKNVVHRIMADAPCFRFDPILHSQFYIVIGNFFRVFCAKV